MPQQDNKKVQVPDDRSFQIANDLRPMLNRLARHLRREAMSAGSSTIDVFILGTVKNHPGISVSELAELEDLTRPSMSAHIKRLRVAGWLTTSESYSSDLRRLNLMLTEAGQEALARVRKRSNVWLARRLQALSEDKREMLARATPALEDLLDQRPKDAPAGP